MTGKHWTQWNQRHEEEWLHNIGGNVPRGARRFDKRHILRGYLAGLKRRTDWENLDPERCREVAMKLLHELEHVQ